MYVYSFRWNQLCAGKLCLVFYMPAGRRWWIFHDTCFKKSVKFIHTQIYYIEADQTILQQLLFSYESRVFNKPFQKGQLFVFPLMLIPHLSRRHLSKHNSAHLASLLSRWARKDEDRVMGFCSLMSPSFRQCQQLRVILPQQQRWSDVNIKTQHNTEQGVVWWLCKLHMDFS